VGSDDGGGPQRIESASTSARPLISVIIPTHNRAGVIARAVESVLAQDYEPMEVVVVDDGSTDDTQEVLRRFATRIRCLVQENKERGAARNSGIAATTGDLIAFLDSDDEMAAGQLSRLSEVLSDRPEIGIAYGPAEFFDDRTGEIFDVFPRHPVTGDAFLECAIGNRMTIGSVVVRRSLLDTVGWFDEDRQLSGMEDWEFWTRCLGASQVMFVDGGRTRIHFHDRNTLGDPASMERAIRTAATKIRRHPRNRKRLAPQQRRLRVAMWTLIAHHYMLAGDGSTARRRLIEGVREDPSMIASGTWLAMAAKAAVGTRMVHVLRRVRRAMHLRRTRRSIS